MIQPPAINLARRPFHNNTAYYAVYAACAALLAAATTYNVWTFVMSGEQLESLRGDVTFVNNRYMKLYQDVDTIKKEISGLDLSVINTKSAFADALITSRLFSWSKLFDDLEDLIPPEVKVQRIAPSISAKRIEITLTGMARSPQAFLEFEANLAGSEFFSNVYPIREDQQESQAELKYSLVMDYIPAGKEMTDSKGGQIAQAGGGGLAAADLSQAPPVAPGAAGPQEVVAQGAPSGDGMPVGAAEAARDEAPAPGAASSPAGTFSGAPAAVPPPMASAGPGPSPAAPAPPPGLLERVKDPSVLTDEQFIRVYGYPEFVRVRGKGKFGKAKAKSGPVVDPNVQAKP